MPNAPLNLSGHGNHSCLELGSREFRLRHSVTVPPVPIRLETGPPSIPAVDPKTIRPRPATMSTSPTSPPSPALTARSIVRRSEDSSRGLPGPANQPGPAHVKRRQRICRDEGDRHTRLGFPDPQQIQMRARLPDGNEIAAPNDGSVQQMRSDRLQAQTISVAHQPAYGRFCDLDCLLRPRQ
jgi:hypothetical protein